MALSKWTKFSRKSIAVFLCILLVCSAFSAYIAYNVGLTKAQSSSITTNTMTGGTMPGAATYTIYLDGGTCYAKNQWGANVASLTSTNAGTTIQATITTAEALGTGASIYITPGTYVTSANTKIYILGNSGNEATLDIYGVRGDTGQGTLVTFSGANSGFQIGNGGHLAGDLSIHGLSIEGDGTAGSAALNLQGTLIDSFQNLKLLDFDTAILMNATSAPNSLNIFSNIEGYNIAYGINYMGTNDNNGNTFQSIYISGVSTSHGQIGVNAPIGSFNHYYSLWLDSYTLGVYINDSFGNTWDSLTVDNSVNGVQIINCPAQATKNVFTNPVFVVTGTAITSATSMGTQWIGSSFSTYGLQYITSGTAIPYYLGGTATYVSAQIVDGSDWDGHISVSSVPFNSTCIIPALWNNQKNTTATGSWEILWKAEYSP